MRKIPFIIVLVVQNLSAQFTDFNITKEVKTNNKGVVVSAHPLASEAGAKILRMGGNAYDAAIATQFALAVVYPQAGNIGGGGFLVGSKTDGTHFTLDYRESAPKRAHSKMYLDKNGKAKTDWSQNGYLAVGIPGSVAGMFATLPHCQLKMSDLIQPAIDLAEKGFSITAQEARLLNNHQEIFLKFNSKNIPFIKNEPWQTGDLLIQKKLAETLKNIQKNGEKAFYEGKIALNIVKNMEANKGIITLEDLKSYKVIQRKPLEFNYKNHHIITMPLPSSGGILLAQMLTMAGFENLEKYEQNSTEAMQIMIEAERRAYADRAEYMGDPDFIKDKTEYLVSKDYLKNRWANFSLNKATSSADVGKIIKQPKESTETTHISVIDKLGNAASITTTLNGLYGSKVYIEDSGFFLNNEMDDFSIKPGVPNMFGAVGGEANKIEPSKRMLSSMTPTIVLKENKPYLVVGTPGGTTIPTSVFQAIVNIIDFKINANWAVNSPKFHHQWLPETVTVEENFPKKVIEELKSKNYTIEKTRQIGRTELILIDEKGFIHAVADGRGDDSVAVE